MGLGHWLDRGTGGLVYLFKQKKEVNVKILAKRFILLSAAICLWQGQVFGNEIIYRLPGFTFPEGSIAYMGSVYSPLKIYEKGKKSRFKVGNPDLKDSAEQSVSNMDDGLLKEAIEDKLPLYSVHAAPAYQQALLMHILEPAKWAYHPQIAKLCEGYSYALICVIDYDDGMTPALKLREMENGQTISYWRKRPILETEEEILQKFFKARKVMAVEVYLISTKDGTPVWQGVGVNNDIGGFFTSGEGPAGGLVRKFLKDLVK